MRIRLRPNCFLSTLRCTEATQDYEAMVKRQRQHSSQKQGANSNGSWVWVQRLAGAETPREASCGGVGVALRLCHATGCDIFAMLGTLADALLQKLHLKKYLLPLNMPKPRAATLMAQQFSTLQDFVKTLIVIYYLLEASDNQIHVIKLLSHMRWGW